MKPRNFRQFMKVSHFFLLGNQVATTSEATAAAGRLTVAFLVHLPTHSCRWLCDFVGWSVVWPPPCISCSVSFFMSQLLVHNRSEIIIIFNFFRCQQEGGPHRRGGRRRNPPINSSCEFTNCSFGPGVPENPSFISFPKQVIIVYNSGLGRPLPWLFLSADVVE